MKTTLAWLKEHLDTDAPLAAITDRLVMLGHEVVVEAQLVSRAQHASRGHAADHGFLQQRTSTRNDGACRGEDAFHPGAGVGRTADHLNLALSGIDDADSEPVGVPYTSFAGLGDIVLDIKVTPNRADCLGVRGIARDLAAVGLGCLKPLDTSPVAGRLRSPVAVHIEDLSACPLFLGRYIRGVHNGLAPDWLHKRLEALGLRPISALVDITNFLTLDVNRPLHVFDADRLAGDLTVRLARDGETLLALNGQEYALDPEVTVIVDEAGVQSLGGVIGGERTGCTEATTEVFIEAALFDPVRTAATGRRLNITSDARYRFERGLDPAFVQDGLEIATRLVLEICGGEASEIVTAGSVPDWRRQYALRAERPATLGGLDVPREESATILAALGCEVETLPTGDLSVEPPPWRGDIVGEADLVEEVLRIKGYDQVPAVPLERDEALPRPALAPAQRRAELVRRTLARRGLVEAVTFSFIAAREAELFGGVKPQLRLVNPISSDLDAMRPSLLPGLIAAARRNADRGIADAGLFEVGPLYRGEPKGQILTAGGVRAGHTGPKHWRAPPREVDLYDVKADALAVLAAMGAPADNVQVTADPPAWCHPGQAGSLRLGSTMLGAFGELHPAVLEALDARPPIAAFEVFLDAVPTPRGARSKPPLHLSVFQPIERDFAFIVDRQLPAESLLRAARGVDRKLVSEIRLFDVYEGAGLPEGKKSLAITVLLQPQERTLTDAEIDGFSKRLITQVEKATGGTLRG